MTSTWPCTSASYGSWTRVAVAQTNSSTENVSHSGKAGTYRWRVYSYSGAGSYVRDDPPVGARVRPVRRSTSLDRDVERRDILDARERRVVPCTAVANGSCCAASSHTGVDR